MFCSNCGKELKDTDNFCPYCGHKVTFNTSSSTAQSNQQNQTPVVIYQNPNSSSNATCEAYSETSRVAIKVFLLLNLIMRGFLGIFMMFVSYILCFSFFGPIFYFIINILPLAFQIPLTIYVWIKLDKKEHINIAVSIILLITTSLVAGILLLVGKDKK